MSYALDANVLLYASDSESPFHREAGRVLEQCAAGEDLVYLAWPTVMAYLRIATHPAVFRKPLTSEEACLNVEALMELPNVRLLSESEGFWRVYRAVVDELPVRGNLVPDAHLVALLKQNGISRIVSGDRDFRKFRLVEVINPFGES